MCNGHFVNVFVSSLVRHEMPVRMEWCRNSNECGAISTTCLPCSEKSIAAILFVAFARSSRPADGRLETIFNNWQRCPQCRRVHMETSERACVCVTLSTPSGNWYITPVTRLKWKYRRWWTIGLSRQKHSNNNTWKTCINIFVRAVNGEMAKYSQLNCVSMEFAANVYTHCSAGPCANPCSMAFLARSTCGAAPLHVVRQTVRIRMRMACFFHYSIDCTIQLLCCYIHSRFTNHIWKIVSARLHRNDHLNGTLFHVNSFLARIIDIGNSVVPALAYNAVHL